MVTETPFLFACPACGTKLQRSGVDEFTCPQDGRRYLRQEDIWRFLLPERWEVYRQFVHEYETVRRAEGRGSPDAAYFRALPYCDLSGRMPVDWRIRASSFDCLLKRIVAPLERKTGRSLRIADLGAGNGWLSNRLAGHGHQVAAVDLLDNTWDGLGAHVHYETTFTPLQAEFDSLPFLPGTFDLVIYNASFHYSVDYRRSLAEAVRVLGADGRVVVMDSPLYRNPASGELMVSEREACFSQRYGFPSNALPSENYLTEARLQDLSAQLGLHWQVFSPFYGLRWMLRPWLARLRRLREPARFVLLVSVP